MYSIEIENFMKAVRQCQMDYEYYFENVGKKDKEKCDLEHEIELANKYKDRVKVVPKLHKILKERRISKDIVENTEPIVNFIKENHKVFKQMEQLLGQVRKVEKSHRGRTYRARIREDLTICNYQEQITNINKKC